MYTSVRPNAISAAALDGPSAAAGWNPGDPVTKARGGTPRTTEITVASPCMGWTRVHAKSPANANSNDQVVRGMVREEGEGVKRGHPLPPRIRAERRNPPEQPTGVREAQDRYLSGRSTATTPHIDAVWLRIVAT